MHRNYFKWVIAAAIASLFLVTIFMWSERKKEGDIEASAPNLNPVSPFKTYISAAGVVEPSSENIYLGSPVNRIISKINVKVGEKVKIGTPLFELESRDLKADLFGREIAYENAQANLAKLEALPRKEDVMAANANLTSVQVELDQAKSLYQSVEGLQNSGAMSQEEVRKRYYLFKQAEAKFQQAQADYDKIAEGAWKPDITIAKLQVQHAEALVKQIQADIQRTIIQSPIDATVLQIKIHEGEFPPSDSSRTPSMIIGDTDTMHLRVDINQFDSSYFNPESPAVAFLQGNANVSFQLQFLQLQPYFVTKQNLTNDISEKVDTRVLQAIYSLKNPDRRLFVGQQMDVFIETQPDYIADESIDG